MECRVCHNPHYQKQKEYGSASYLYSGTSTGITTSTITKTWAFRLCTSSSDGGTNLHNNGTCVATFFTGDPLLAALANNGGPAQTMALQAGSPAIDAGITGTCLSTDQRGQSRPVDGDGDLTPACDIGAYEYVP